MDASLPAALIVAATAGAALVDRISDRRHAELLAKFGGKAK